MSLEPLAENLGRQIQHHEELLELLITESELPAKTPIQKLQDLQEKQGELFDKIKTVEILEENVPLALSINNEKARSELIIA